MRYFIIILIYTLSANLQAFESFSQGSESSIKKYTLGTTFGTHYAIFDQSNDDSDTLSQFELFYEYHFDKTSSLHTKFYTGSNGNDMPDGEFDASGFQVSYKTQITFFDNWDVYGRVGANIYKTKVANGGGSDSSAGLGLVAATGLEYVADNGFLLGANIEYFTAGELDVASLYLSVGFSF